MVLVLELNILATISSLEQKPANVCLFDLIWTNFQSEKNTTEKRMNFSRKKSIRFEWMLADWLAWWLCVLKPENDWSPMLFSFSIHPNVVRLVGQFFWSWKKRSNNSQPFDSTMTMAQSTTIQVKNWCFWLVSVRWFVLLSSSSIPPVQVCLCVHARFGKGKRKTLANNNFVRIIPVMVVVDGRWRSAMMMIMMMMVMVCWC